MIPTALLTPLMKYVGMALAVIVIGYGVWKWGYSIAEAEYEVALAQAQETQRQKEIKVLADLETEKAKRKVIYVDRIKKVETAVDPSKCADADVPRGIDEQLRSSSDGTVRRATP